MPYSDELAFKTPPPARTVITTARRGPYATAPGAKTTPGLTHATNGGPVMVGTSAVAGKAADDRIAPVALNNPTAGTGRDSLVGASGVGGVVVIGQDSTPKTPWYTGSKPPSTAVTPGGRYVAPTARTGGSGITPKATYPTSGTTPPDQGGGVGGVSPATNTGTGGMPWTKMLEIVALAAVAFLLVIYLRKHGTSFAGAKAGRKRKG